jgi:putative Holliday junction resolvase
MPEIIGIDFGLKRTGIAISDSQQIIATPFKTVDSKELMAELSTLINVRGIKEIVIGFPTQLNGNDTDITQNVRLLKDAIEKNFNSIKVYFQDERFTSKIASQTIAKIGTSKQRKNKELIDQVSATVFLQDFLNGKNA